ncbi:MAG: acyltransferase family protein [Cellvibrionaceae bacterium]
MKRLSWLDSSRGLAILLLIVIHYVGALETREFISYDTMNLMKAVLRVATPLFIFIFGFTFSIVYLNKILLSNLFEIYRNLWFKLFLIFIARQTIVFSNYLKGEIGFDQLIDVLLYREFSQSGEILTFYFIAIIFSPIALYWIHKKSNITGFFTVCLLYFSSYFVGSNFDGAKDNMLFRLFFYDVYAFFPFFSLVLFSFLLGKIYQNQLSDAVRLKYFLCVSIIALMSGLCILFDVADNPIVNLAEGTLKSPPHVSYMLIYIGVSLLIVISVAILSRKRLLFSNFFLGILSSIGKNSLLFYVIHYYYFLPTLILPFLFDVVTAFYELLAFLLIFVLSVIFVCFLDGFKKSKAQ